MLLHDESPEAVVEREQSFIQTTYARTPFHPRKGEGAKLVDAAGKEYWDLLSGIAVNALGYRHPAIDRVLDDAKDELLHISNLYFHPAQGLLAEKLIELSKLSKVFFCNSGTEANEAALKFARLKNSGRTQVVALEEAFHGRTIGALSLTGHEAYRTPFGSLLDGVKFVEPNNIDALKAAVTTDTAAVFLEPVMGEGGIIPLTGEFLRAARMICDETGALLVLDEIQCGLGRTGEMFAFTEAGIEPDIVTLAKPLGGGLPLGAVITGPALNGVVSPGMHGTTFGGNPLACRLGLAVLETIERERLLPKINETGEWFEAEAKALAFGRNDIVEIRGKGLMWGIELDRPAGPVARALLEKGFVVGTAREKVIRLLPPYIVPKEALSAFLNALEEVLDEGKPKLTLVKPDEPLQCAKCNSTEIRKVLGAGS